MLPVYVLRNDHVVLEQVLIRAGEGGAIEIKIFKPSSWQIAPNVDRTVGEVTTGFLDVDPLKGGHGQSLVATTPEILADPDLLLSILRRINDLPDPAYANRAGVIILERSEQAYSAEAFALLRGLLE
jgi:hypothetical protein